MPLVYNAALAARTDYTDDLAMFAIAPDEPPAPGWFEPGQYCLLGLEHDGRAVRRPMTLASAPERDGPLEFFINRVETPASDAPLTHALWRLSAGDRLFLRVRATGKFTLRYTIGAGDGRRLLFVATETGAAPFASMIRSAALRDPRADLSRIAFLHGAARPAELAFDDEMRELARTRGLRYVGAVAPERATDEWRGDTGSVEDMLAPDRAAELARRLAWPEALAPATAAIYVCGLQPTISRCIALALARGFIPDYRRLRRAIGVADDVAPSLFFEQYDNARLFDTGDDAAMAALRQALAAAPSPPATPG